MKLRSTTPVSKRVTRRVILVVIALLVAVSVPISFSLKANADEYDAQIAALQREIDQYNAKAAELGAQADTLQRAVDVINNEIARIQKEIDLNQAQVDQLNAEIKKNDDQIAANKEALGDTIASIYVDDKESPLITFASSKNIGDYVDKQAYRSSARDNLTKTINTIRDLKKQNETNKRQIELKLADQQNARAEQDKQRAQQQSILDQTRGQESAYKDLSDSVKQKQLQVQQAQQAAIEAAIRRAGGGRAVVLPGTSGGYPWDASNCYVDAYAYSYNGVDGNGGDGMGYGCRQCVSYVAWRIYKETGYAPAYWGNAYDWPSSGRRAGFTVSSIPRAHAAGVITSGGSPGHIVWVESVDTGSGTMVVSQYNYYNAGGSGWGNYSRMQVPIGTYQQYIYF